MGTVYLPPGRQTYMLSFTDARGERRRISSGCRDEASARARLDQIEADVTAERNGDKAVHVRRAAIGLVILDYAEHLRSKGRVAGHVRDALTTMTAIADLGSFGTLGDVTVDSLTYALAAYVKSGRSASSANKARRFYLAMFRWLNRRGLWESNPAEKLEPMDAKPRKKRAVSTAELEKFIAAAPERRRLVYEFAAATGMRRGEIRQLRWQDLDLDDGFVRVRAEITKTRTARRVPLSPTMMAKLREHAAKNPGVPAAPVFKSMPQHDTFRADVKRAGLEFETPDGIFCFHSLRKQAATDMFRAGVHPQAAADVLGHKDIRTTMKIYTEADDGQARDAVLRMEELRRKA